MGCHSYDDLKRHIGHKVVVSCYGGRDDPQNVAVECETCYEIIMDFDKKNDDVWENAQPRQFMYLPSSASSLYSSFMFPHVRLKKKKRRKQKQ